jgi:hypothetical protein
LLLHPQSPGYLLDSELRLGERRKLDQPYPVLVGTREFPGHLKGQPGLALTPGTSEGQESGRGECPLDLAYLPLASHEAGLRFGQIVPAEVGHPLVCGIVKRRQGR